MCLGIELFYKLLGKLNNVAKSQVRQLEKLKKRLIAVRWSNYFYEICYKNNYKYVKFLNVLYIDIYY